MVMVSTLPIFLAGSSFLQLEADIGLTATSLGLLTAVFFLTAAITSAPLGRLIERIGWKTAMRINCVVSASIVVLIAAFGTNTVAFGALLVVGGAAYGFTNPAANLALAQRAAKERRGLVFGLKHAGIPSSTLFAGAALPLFVLTIGWRPTFALSAVFAVVAWILINAEPDDAGALDGKIDEARPLGALTQGQLVVLALGSACATWAAVSLGLFLVAAAVDASLTESQAGVLLFAGSAASITARVLAGLLADRRSSPGFGAVATMMALGAGAFVFISGAVGPAFALWVLAAFAMGWGWPGLMTYSVVRANEGTAASSSAITQAGIFLGAGIGPLALGWVIDVWSFEVGWLVVAAFLTLAAAIVTSVAVRVRATATPDLIS